MDNIEKDSVKRARNDIAALQSIIPGLGHIYKGYYFQGLIVMLLAPVVFYIGAVLFLATAGISSLFPLAYWTLVAIHAYYADDHRKHHIGIL
ncbi:MAG TPA: hypothetical protein VKA34_07240 [Balneolales bacterium]|nr:hypothetical protein [Balneolales bacterium]